MSFRPWSWLVALSMTLLAAGEAAAAPSWLELRWPDVAGCPTREEVEATALRLTAGESPQSVTAEASITADAAGYTLDLRVHDSGGAQQRILHSPKCEALAGATAVILAVAAAPIGVSARVVAAPTPGDALEVDLTPLPITGPPAPAPATDLAPTPSPSSSPSRLRPGLAIGFGAAAGIGPSQRFTAGLSGNVSLLWRRVRLDLRGSGWFPGLARASDLPGIGVKLQLAAGAVRGCPRLVRRTVSLELCAGLELGALLAEGAGLQQNDRSRGLWAAGLLAPGVRWQPLRWLSLGIEVEGLVAFTRRQYRASDADTLVYTVPPVGVRLGGGLALHIF
ncbi:hypothetical protein OV203_40590 [Nannocystis sp. ILAH1]|uniref:hypothetical protein n=1 Tax=Nannocystis sp. ILAH1 TaxID=2996789 RepID=UPI00226FBE72|nr:hypothetical protein [Nannocystis sp. ILAH1]MCY0993507.1 hypothetical protein [Nannocystis sp. ILAH1]